MAKDGEAKDDWSFYLEDDLDDDLNAICDASFTSPAETKKADNLPKQANPPATTHPEVITIEDYDEEEEQFLQAIILSLEDTNTQNNNNKTKEPSSTIGTLSKVLSGNNNSFYSQNMPSTSKLLLFV